MTHRILPLLALFASACGSPTPAWPHDIVFGFQGRDQDFSIAVKAAEAWNTTCGTHLKVIRGFAEVPIKNVDELPGDLIGEEFDHDEIPKEIDYKPQQNSLYQYVVFAHEIGHAIGARHVDDQNDLMFHIARYHNDVRPENCARLP